MLMEGVYDCVERMVVNAYCPMGQTGGGMRSWWRRLRGDDTTLDDAHLRDMAGTFSRRVHAYCAKQGIRVIDTRAGERKHEWAEEYLPEDPDFRGLFLVMRATRWPRFGKSRARPKVASSICTTARRGRT